MENYQQHCKQIAALMRGEIKADSINADVETWLKLTCFSLAWEICQNPNKEDRVKAIEKVKIQQPLFYDDVKAIAKQIWSDHLTGKIQLY